MHVLYPYRFAALLTAVLLSQTSCSIGYYWQASVGHMRIVNGKQPVAELLQEPEIAAAEQARLQLSQEALDFAHQVMLLPDNGSYRSYYDTGQSYVVWNVFAAPELSLEPLTWCFPVAGCIAYRGYFKADKAREYAAKLDADGNDVYVGGVTAYSTLGNFRDPILNTMLDMPEPDFVGLLFHELAHQQLYVKDDSAFNEGFASAVEQDGIHRWQSSRTESASQQRLYTPAQMYAVLGLLRPVRDRLDAIYAAKQDDETKRAQKAELLAGLANEYANLAADWEAAGLNGRPYGALFARGLNNASLAAIGTYDNYVPAFAYLLQQCAAELKCFYERAAEIGALEADARETRMRELLIAARNQ